MNLEEIYINRSDPDNLHIAITKYCPNLRSLYILKDDIETLKEIFNSCQLLETIEICYNYKNNLTKNLCELKLLEYSTISTEDLEEFFINWKNRIPQKSLSFMINKNENMRIIEKYKELDIIKGFDEKFKRYEDY
ncbi:hypothetical protein C1645_834042 [Glomus cerebriforme]|uniref:F-box domain-containing protein n=1 Tax=Glomus cerebriforme TaxID=658196 RepID=A0A397SAD6_9GLOM|nr:hypothetical protein C1645_834042 [Glomus cerebriforme]